MSSGSGGGSRGRGRGHAVPKGNAASRNTPGAPRGHNNNNNNNNNNIMTGSKRGSHATRGIHGTAGRGGSRAAIPTPRANGPRDRNAVSKGGSKTHGDWQERHQMLKQLREKERADAIRRGLMADPDKPRALADAITPVGTCQDMCPEYERVLRVVQKDVWDEETNPNHSAFARGEPEPDEFRMVKKFRRSAAGNDEQLPSDLRPPLVLKRTCDYLFHDVIGNSISLAKVHHFVWDRTRAIRNDFSIQQLTRPEDLRVAIECYERIARFHIMSLHLLASPETPYDKYDAQQEREQLDRTLVSLMQYYDDCRDRFEVANEAEFRAYTIIFQLRDSNPDLEDRVQGWPSSVTSNARVQKAIDIFAAACDSFDDQGPLKPPTSHAVARQDWGRFWQIVSSSGVSYLMACVAEIYFNPIRRMVLRSLFRSTSKKSAAAKTASGLEWSVDELWDLFNFDAESELIKFCEHFGFSFQERDEDGQLCLDFSSVPGRNFPEPTAGIPVQSKSSIVESKRYRRSMQAIVDGLSVHQASIVGLLDHKDVDSMTDVPESLGQSAAPAVESQEDEDSLFVPEVNGPAEEKFQTPGTHTTTLTSTPASVSVFASPAFGKPSIFGQPSQSTGFNFNPTKNSQLPESTDVKSILSFSSNQATGKETDQKNVKGSPFAFTALGSRTAGESSPPKERSVFSFAPTVGVSPSHTLFESGVLAAPVSDEPSTAGQTSDNYVAKPNGSEQTTGNAMKVFGLSTAGGPAGTFSAPISSTQSSSLQSAPTLPQEKTSVLAQPAPIPPTISAADQQSNAPFTFAQPFPNATHMPEPHQPYDGATKTLQPPTQSQSPSSNAQTIGTSPAASSVPLNAQGLRRQSVNDWRPKTPSKLSNSFTVNSDGSPPQQKASRNMSHMNKAAVESSPDHYSHPSKPLTTQALSISPAFEKPSPPSLDSIVSRLAQELTFDPIAGFMTQYMDFYISHVVTEVQESIYYERVNKEADDFRQFHLAQRYGRRWRNTCRHHRLSKQGRERRRRAQRRLHQANAIDASKEESSRDDASVQGDGTTASLATRSESRHEEIDAMFQSTLGTHQTLRDTPARIGNKRSGVSDAHDAQAHKRMKKPDVTDDIPSATSARSTLFNHHNLSQRSSFLAFSLPNSAPNRASTTKSSYFRMKALGIGLGLDKKLAHSLKRPRSESLGVPTSSKLLKFDSTSVRSSPEHTRIGDARPSSSSSATVNVEDEALFARLKAAREGLRNNSDFLRSEIERGGNLQTSTISTSSSDSPSMALARAEARRKAASTMSGRDVPAYRLRESRFVPRDDYVRAIERSKELRASRSQESSRPGSGSGQHPTGHFKTSSIMTSHPPPESQYPLLPSTSNTYGILDNTALLFDKTPKTSQTLFRKVESDSFGSFIRVPDASASKPTSTSGMAQLDLDLKAGITSGPASGQLRSGSLLNSMSNAPRASDSLPGFDFQPTQDFSSGEIVQQDGNRAVALAQIPSAPSNSFERPAVTVGNLFAPSTSDSTTPPQTCSHISSRTEPILSNNDDNPAIARFALAEQPHSSPYQDTSNGLTQKSHPYPDLPNAFAGPNRFAALADEDADDDESVEHNANEYGRYDEVTSEEIESEGDEPEDDESEDYKWAKAQNGYGSDEEGEFSNMDGDVEDYTDQDMDGDVEEPDTDLDADDGEEEEGRGAGVAMGHYYIQPPPKLPAVEEGAGNTAEEPIELSD